MPYLTLVGHIATNVSGVGARGYHVFRRGTTVFSAWGPIEVLRGRTVSLRWARATPYKIYRFRSVAGAKEKVVALLRKIEVREKYKRLPQGAKIKRHAGAPLGKRHR